MTVAVVNIPCQLLAVKVCYDSRNVVERKLLWMRQGSAYPGVRSVVYHRVGASWALKKF